MEPKAMALLQKHWAILTATAFILLLGVFGFSTRAGVSWDFANGLGFAGAVCLLMLCLASPNRYPVRAHQLLSYLLLVFVVLHIALLLWLEPLTLEYLKPLAPIYMWAGLVATVLLLILILSSLPSLRPIVHRHRDGYRLWHRNLTWLCVGATLYHLLGSGFYVGHVIYWLLLPMFAVYCLKPIGLPKLEPLPWWQPMLILTMFTLLFTFARGFSL